MRLTVVGCAGSFPGPDSAASCYLVEADDAAGRTWRVLLDLGSGALGPLQLYTDPRDVDVVALSHLHADHVADMTGLYVYLKYQPVGASADGPGSGGPRPPATHPVQVYGPFGSAARLGALSGLDPEESLGDQLAVHTWQAGRAVHVGPMTLTPVSVEHPVPAYGIRVEGPAEDDPDERVVLAYSGDTDECPGLDEVAAGADVLLAEAAFVEGRDDAVRGLHLTGRRAGRAAARGRVGHLVLTHVPAWNDPQVAAEEAVAVYDGPVTMAHPGLVLTL